MDRYVGTNCPSIDQQQTPLCQALSDMAQQSSAAFHTPGHRRGRGLPTVLLEQLGTALGKLDLPELPGLDNLFAPESVIQEAQNLAAALFGAEQTWFLTNGSTCGITAAILATCGPGDYIIVPRNSHTSVISGLILSGAMPILLQPAFDPVLNLVHCLAPDAIQLALAQFPQTKAVLVVYPTYEGVCGDIARIAALVHEYGIPLLVDEAHGPHFGFHPDLPQSALAAGADLAVQSTHKMLGALTQAAMLHVQGPLLERPRISQALQLVQSTSPNYLLLASLDAARQQMAVQGQALMEEVLTLALRARSHLQNIQGYSNWVHPRTASGCIALDQTRLNFPAYLCGHQGYDLDQILIETYGVMAELVTPDHLTFLISLGNTSSDIDQLTVALHQLVQASPRVSQALFLNDLDQPPLSVPDLSPRDAYWRPCIEIPFLDAVGYMSAECICPYPPGIPILLPGEQIQVQDLTLLSHIKNSGGSITGCSDPSLRTLKVVRE